MPRRIIVSQATVCTWNLPGWLYGQLPAYQCFGNEKDRERMKRIIAILGCVLLGVGIGWYLGYTRPALRNQKKLLAWYQDFRDTVQLTDAEVADFALHHAEYFEAMKRQDETAVVVALSALMKLEQGDIEKARSRLETAVSDYYRVHHKDGNTNVLHRIVAFAATNAALSNAISRKLE